MSAEHVGPSYLCRPKYEQELVNKFIFFFAQIQLSKFNINTYTVYNIRQQPKGNYGARQLR